MEHRLPIDLLEAASAHFGIVWLWKAQTLLSVQDQLPSLSIGAVPIEIHFQSIFDNRSKECLATWNGQEVSA
jgi:hypothetical protein